MRKNLARFGVAAALMLMSAQAVSGQTTGDPLLGAVEGVAALPGAPSTVSAAGLTPAGQRILTLEPTGGIPDPAKRLVIVGGLDGKAESARAVLEALRWFKTEAPAEVRRAWSITAVPCAYPEQCLTGSTASGRALANTPNFPPEGGFYNHETAPEPRYLWRWVAFQSPDLVLEVRSGQTLSWEISRSAIALPLDGPPPPDGTLAAAVSVGAPSGLGPVAAVRASTSVVGAPQMLRSLLEAAASLRRSPLHDAILARISRTPVEIAKILANRYPASPAMSYISAVAWSNTLRLAARLGDAALVEKVRDQMAPFLPGETPVVTEPYRLTSLAGLFAFLDFSEPGQSDEALAVAIAGAEFMFPPFPDGPQAPDAILRSPTGWTDDMFMVSSLLSRLGARTGDARYGAIVGRLLTTYAETLQRPDGLFVHSARGPHPWGRGNGFAILGLTDALTFLPDDWAERARVLDIYRRHAEALIGHQGPAGMWHQVVDEPGSYRELTVTSMTLVALARGVRLGWLEDAYEPAIERAWLGIAARIAEDGAVVDASTSTGAGETKQYYLDRTAIFAPDDRGGAMALWAAMEMDELRRQRSGASAQNAPDSVVPPSDIRDVFATGYILEDRNGDQVTDFVNVRIVLPATPEEAHVTAAANLAARLGYETSAMNLGLTETNTPGSSSFDVPVILIGEGAGGLDEAPDDRTAGLAPGQGAISFVPENERFTRGGIHITGYDATGLIAAADYASGRYPSVWGLEGDSFSDVADRISSFLEQQDVEVDRLTLDRIVVDATRLGVSRLVATVSVPDSASFARAQAALEPPDSVSDAADAPTDAPPDSPPDPAPQSDGDDQDRLARSDLDFADLHRIDIRVSGPEAARTIRLLPDEVSETVPGAAFSAPEVSDFTLSDLYTIQGLFSDTNEDLVADRVDAYISLHGADAPSGPVDLAARIGLESAGIRLPLVRTAGQDDYPETLGFPILYGVGHYQTERLRDEGRLHTAGGGPTEGGDTEGGGPTEGFVEMVPEAFGDEHALVISGSDAAGLGAVSDYVARRLPYLWEHGKGEYRLEDVENEVRRFFQGRGAAGQLSLATHKLRTWLDRLDASTGAGPTADAPPADGPPAVATTAVTSPPVESITLEISTEQMPEGFDRFVREIIEERFPEAEASVATYATGFGVGDTIFQQNLDFPWEVDTFRDAFRDEALPRIGSGSRGRVRVRVSEPPEVRQALEVEIRTALETRGPSRDAFDVEVLSAYKQGFSWLNDSVLPRLRGMAIGSIEIAYHTLKESEEVRWQRVASPTRWLQELYPIDAVLARDLGIPESAVTFTPRVDDDPIYTVTVRSTGGAILLEDSFTPKYVVRPFFDLFPEYEQVRVTTGWVTVEVDGQAVLDRRIETDPEIFWDVLQTDTYRRIVDYVMDVQQGRPSSANAPYYDEFRIDLRMSEPNYRIGIDEEVVSSLEALHEDLYFETLTLFNLIGGRYGTGPMSYGGRILPYIDPNGTGLPGHATISFTGKARAIPELEMTVRRAESEPVTQRYRLSSLPVDPPKLRGVAVRARDEGLSRMLFEVAVSDSTDRYEEFRSRGSEEGIDRSFLSIELLSGMVDALRDLHQNGMIEEALSLDRVEELAFRFTQEDSTAFTRMASLPRSRGPASTDNPVLLDDGFRYEGERIVQWDLPIPPSENDQILAKLNTFPGVDVYYMTQSFLGQNVYAADFLLPMDAELVSQAKLNALKPTLFLSGRQHANEVSSTSHILRLGELLATDSAYADLLKKVNVVLHPITNADGARLAVQMQETNPDFMLHAGYLGALGVDIAAGQDSDDPIYPESKVRPRLWETWLPDIYINMHGYPTHEWVQYFAGYSAWVRSRNGGQRDWWSPRGWFIPGFNWVDDDEYEDITTAQFAILDSVAASITGEPAVEEMNQRLYARYRKYGAQDVENFREYFHNGMLVSQALTGQEVSGSGPTNPRIMYFATTTEAPDETARGEWLQLVATAGLAHSSALLRYLASGENRIERESSEHEGFVTRSVFRTKPVLPAASEELEAPSDSNLP